MLQKMKAGKSFGKIMPYLEITQKRNISIGKVSKHCILDWKSIHEYSFWPENVELWHKSKVTAVFCPYFKAEMGELKAQILKR